MKDLTAGIHVKPNTVASWRAGKGYPRIAQMLRICEFFGVSRSEMHEDGFSLRYMEDQLNKHFNALSAEGKRQLLDVAETLKEMYPNTMKR